MFRRFRQLLEMIRFSHTLFALPFALLSAALAWYSKPQGFQWVELVGILLWTAGETWVAARIFRVGILMQGQPPRLSEILRWAWAK